MTVIEPLEAARKTGVKFVDASWAMPGSPPPAPRTVYSQMRIGNAVFFDIDEIADKATALPHMLPPAAQFAAQVSALGISNDDDIIVYDQEGIAMAAARAWWMFRAFGHDRVTVLNGGLPAWVKAGLPLNHDAPIAPAQGDFKAQLRPELVASMAHVHGALQHPDTAILDARGAARFGGTAAEPRPGVRGGHMPGSFNVPYGSVMDADGRLLAPEALRAMFAAHDARDKIITSCGSGVTACVLALALFAAGRTDAAVYDGSWAEWGRNESNTPVEILK